jgi:hypothetical protein
VTLEGPVCLECGAEMEYDWAPCPKCGWKPPENWEAEGDEVESLDGEPRPGVMSKPRGWITWTTLVLLFAILLFLILSLLR